MFNQININIFKAINNLAGGNVIFDKLIIFLAEYTPYIFILILLSLWFQKREDKNIVLLATYSATLGIFINYIISLFYFHTRPFADSIGNNLLQHAPDSSFPSDHTTFMMAIAWLIFYFVAKRKLGASLLLLATMGGVARIYVGVHYPFDILGAVLVAIVSSVIVFVLRRKMQKVNDFFINIYTRACNVFVNKSSE